MPEAEEPKRALVIAAHPDDPDVGAGGTVALWARDGWEIYYLVCTNGAKGSSDPNADPTALVQARQGEQRQAAKTLGVRDVFFLDHEDGELIADRVLLGEVTRYIRTLRPYTIFTHSTELIVGNRGINHTDHRATGQTAIDAVYPTARDPLNFPEHLQEGLQPHKVKQVYIWTSNQPTVSIDITDVVELKVQALMRHESQFGGREDFTRRMLERWQGENGRYFEKFQLVELQF